MSTIEIIIASMLLSTTIASVSLLAIGNTRLIADSQLELFLLSDARLYLDDMEQAVVGSREYSLSTTSRYTFAETEKVAYNSFSELLKTRIKLKNTSFGAPLSVTILAPDFGRARGEDICTIGDTWISPVVRGALTLNSNHSNTVKDIAVGGHFLYIASNASTVADPDLTIGEFEDPEHPTIISTLNTGPGLEAVKTAGTSAFAANTGVAGQLEIISIDNPNAPALQTTYKIPGVTISGGRGIGRTLAYKDKKVFIGLTKADGPEFNIIDVSVTSTPSLLGSFETDTLINRIVPETGRTYIATPESELMILDTENLNVPLLLGSFTASGFGTQDGKSIALHGQRVILGRTVGGFNNPINHELFILDPTDPSDIHTVASRDIAASVNDIVSNDNFLFLATGDPTKEFQVWNISDETSPTLLETVDLPGKAVRLICSHNLLFAAVETPPAVYIIGSTQ